MNLELFLKNFKRVFHQISHLSMGFMNESSGHSKSAENSFEFLTGPKTLNHDGE